MKSRCTNSKAENYGRYGGVGVMFDPAWASFEAFWSDMGSAPSSKHQIDRIDNALGYSKANCRWATDAEQRRNQRRNRRLTIDGRTLVAADWAKELGLTSRTIYTRLARGWSDKDAVFGKAA